MKKSELAFRLGCVKGLRPDSSPRVTRPKGFFFALPDPPEGFPVGL